MKNYIVGITIYNSENFEDSAACGFTVPFDEEISESVLKIMHSETLRYFKNKDRKFIPLPPASEEKIKAKANIVRRKRKKFDNVVGG